MNHKLKFKFGYFKIVGIKLFFLNIICLCNYNLLDYLD